MYYRGVKRRRGMADLIGGEERRGEGRMEGKEGEGGTKR